jgi:hypothetical protein
MWIDASSVEVAHPASWSLKALTTVSRLLPPVRGTARITCRCIRPFYRGTGEVALPIWPGAKMRVDLRDHLGGYLAFLPHVYDRWERQAMTSILRPGDAFVDLGSNLGAYALWAARCVGSSGRVLAIEPDTHNHEVLTENVRLNGRVPDCTISRLRQRGNTLFRRDGIAP